MKKIWFVLFLCFWAVPALAAEKSFVDPLKDENGNVTFESVFSTWTGSIEKAWRCKQFFDVYVPVNTWHNRLFYDKEKYDEYNEMPWGGGFGVSRLDKDGDWHALYFMAFDDSNYHLQTIFGYAYQKNWYFGANEDWHAGLGFTTALTQREDYSYIPVPLPLPLAGFGYKNFEIQAAYVPGVKNNGNVLFTWARMSF